MKTKDREILIDYYKTRKLTFNEHNATLAAVGGFSIELAQTHEFIDYVKSGFSCGYFGSNLRTLKRDQIVEAEMRKLGMSTHSIAFWLTSTSARHLMDVVERKWDVYTFTQHVLRYTLSAPEDVVIWSHPDHQGTMSSTLKIREHLKSLFK